MMTQELLAQLVKLDIRLWMDGDRLRYNAPQGVMTRELKTELAKHKTEIIAYLQNSANQNSINLPVIVPIARTSQLPLSFAQQRLWFLDQFDPGSSYYNIPGAVRLSGNLNETALQQTVNEIVRRHEVLRTTFSTLGDTTPVQVIAEQLAIPVKVLDLRDLAEEEREVRARELEQAEVETPFDLASGPLVRVSLLRLAAKDHILLFTLHHIISDGWSMGVLVKEVAALYAAYVKNQPSPLPELPIQYADFAHWQRQWLRGDMLQRQLDYWTEQLRGSPTLLTLPTDHPRPAIQSHRGAAYSFEISAEITSRLYTLNKQTQTTLFMILTAALNVLLARYSGQSDICIGTAIANRNRAEIEGLIGFFVNTLVIRTRIDDTGSFESFLQQVRSTTLQAYVHQAVPFEQLVEVLKLERHPSHSPLFQVMLDLQNAPMGSLELPGLTLEGVVSESTTAKFDIMLSFVEDDGRLLVSLEYNTDLFERTTIAQMAEHFTRLLEGIVANPSARLQDLPMLNEKERHQILAEWNTTEAEYPQEKCIHELFEEQVERTPEAVAVVFEDQQLTYRELNERANQLAHYLQKMGVGPEVPVGICVKRSMQMVVGLLGILKAGGAYVPLDPTYPPERLNLMLEDTQASVLLTHEKVPMDLLSNIVKPVYLDRNWEVITQENIENTHSGVQPDNLAYVIYTSGSTGQPKGVCGLHQGAINRFSWMWDTWPFQPDEVYCQKTALSFLDSLWEIFGTLLQGVRLVIIPDEMVKDLFEFVRVLAAENVTRITLVPSLLRALLDSHPDLQHQLPKLRFWVTSGEAISLELCERFQSNMPTRVLFNLYGSSEVSADATEYNTQQLKTHSCVPIGHPIANTKVYILDSHLQPIPIGAIGELFVGGVCLARGYYDRPALTAEKFIPNPFSSEPGARIYRSGDLARWLPDGNIEYLGRIDHQVKIRGFRIELGEIEATLAALPEVQEVVVLVREDAPSDKRLVAYLVTKDGHVLPEVSELRSQLARSLPDYMLPTHFIFLDHLPLTPNGKVDRKALPAPDMTRSEVGYVAPRTYTEEILTPIWAEVLKLDKVGIHDNFFELGGHSLLAIQLMTRIEQAFHIQISLPSLFQNPSIAQFAKLVAEHTTTPWSPIVPIHPHGSRTPLFCIHEVTGFASFYTHLAHRLGPDQPLYGLQARGLDMQQAPHTTIYEMATCYREAIQRVQAQGPYLLAGHSMGGLIAYEISQQLRQQGEEIAFLGLLDTYIQIPSDAPELNDREILIQYLRQEDQPIKHLDKMISETDEDIVPKAFVIAQQAELVPPDLSLADFQRYLEIYKAHIYAACTYQPQPYLGPATFFVCQEHPAKDITAKRANVNHWYCLVHDLELREVLGNHHTMILPPHVDDLAAELSNCLRHADNSRKN